MVVNLNLSPKPVTVLRILGNECKNALVGPHISLGSDERRCYIAGWRSLELKVSPLKNICDRFQGLAKQETLLRLTMPSHLTSNAISGRAVYTHARYSLAERPTASAEAREGPLAEDAPIGG